MFKRHTLFVVGAGASHELDMPVGTGLAKAIYKKLDLKPDESHTNPSGEDMAFVQELKNAYQQQPWFAASRLIHNGILLTHSIDAFPPPRLRWRAIKASVHPLGGIARSTPCALDVALPVELGERGPGLLAGECCGAELAQASGELAYFAQHPRQLALQIVTLGLERVALEEQAGKFLLRALPSVDDDAAAEHSIAPSQVWQRVVLDRGPGRRALADDREQRVDLAFELGDLFKRGTQKTLYLNIFISDLSQGALVAVTLRFDRVAPLAPQLADHMRHRVGESAVQLRIIKQVGVVVFAVVGGGLVSHRPVRTGSAEAACSLFSCRLYKMSSCSDFCTDWGSRAAIHSASSARCRSSSA